jgi:hypothetical protein
MLRKKIVWIIVIFLEILLMKLQKTIFLLLLLSGMFLFNGCEIFREALNESYYTEDPTSDEYETKFNIGVFQIVKYPRATMLEQEVDIGDGKTISVNTNALFSSKRILKARAIPRPGDPDIYDLEFKIDRMGKTQWMMLHGTARGEEVVMMVDDRFAGVFIPESLDDGRKDWVTLRVGVDAYTAKGIVKFAQRNYEYYNPEASSWFKYL